jgi:Protein of unknown function (DUF3710)
MALRRRRGTHARSGAPPADFAPAEAETQATPEDRPQGPYDISEVDDVSGLLDLGGIRIRGVEGMELRVEVAQERVVAATAVVGPGAVQIQPFAAPRTAGIWDEVRAEILSSVLGAGGQAEEVQGPFGVELRAIVLTTVDGRQARQPARFVGVDGPRWLLRGVFMGNAVDDPAVAAPLEQVFRSVVAFRGEAPMPPREPIELRLPAGGAGTSVGLET